jgi:hypothetical protein
VIHANSNAFDYFLSRLQEDTSSNVNPEVNVYLAGMLTRMIVSSAPFPGDSTPTAPSKPFGIQYLEMSYESDPRRAVCYQRLGDSILFHTSVFRARFLRGPCPLEYYFALGRSCYKNGAVLGLPSDPVVVKISEHFEFFSDLVQSIMNKKT